MHRAVYVFCLHTRESVTYLGRGRGAKFNFYLSSTERGGRLRKMFSCVAFVILREL